MHDITEHDPKEEWECDYCKHSRVDLLEYGDTISIHDLLEWHGQLIGLEESWLHKPMITLIVGRDMVDLGTIDVPSLSHLVNLVPNSLAELGRTPHQAHQESLPCLEHVQLTVDGFLLENKPLVDLNQ